MASNSSQQKSAIEREAERSFIEQRPLTTLFIVGEILLIGGGLVFNTISGTSSVRGPATLKIIAGLFGSVAILLAVLGVIGFGVSWAIRS